jgi:arginyl-tRNA synthetase
VERSEIAGPGFLNFYLSHKWLEETLRAIGKFQKDYGKSKINAGRKVMVEFVSANPTGPMHMGNARGGALGDSLSSILSFTGCDVVREFYINDAGNQIDKFARSLEARYLQALLGEDALPFPEDGYQGGYQGGAREFIALYGDRHLSLRPEERREALSGYALEKNVAKLKTDLSRYGIEYDSWFRESSLYESGEVEKTLEELKSSGCAYEKDGALFFAHTKFGGEKDEVLVRQNGIPTYFAADIAYHKNKLVTRKFDRAINVWGADHTAISSA